MIQEGSLEFIGKRAGHAMPWHYIARMANTDGVTLGECQIEDVDINDFLCKLFAQCEQDGHLANNVMGAIAEQAGALGLLEDTQLSDYFHADFQARYWMLDKDDYRNNPTPLLDEGVPLVQAFLDQQRDAFLAFARGRCQLSAALDVLDYGKR
jgi:hypothetical protein